MARNANLRWALLVAANVVGWCVLGLYRPGTAAPREAQPPFANAVEQRGEMIEQLKAVVAELKAQNELLKAGPLKVVVVPDKKE